MLEKKLTLLEGEKAQIAADQKRLTAAINDLNRQIEISNQHFFKVVGAIEAIKSVMYDSKLEARKKELVSSAEIAGNSLGDFETIDEDSTDLLNTLDEAEASGLVVERGPVRLCLSEIKSGQADPRALKFTVVSVLSNATWVSLT